MHIHKRCLRSSHAALHCWYVIISGMYSLGKEQFELLMKWISETWWMQTSSSLKKQKPLPRFIGVSQAGVDTKWFTKTHFSCKTTLLWCHMSVMACQITGNSSVCSTAVQTDINESIIASHHWPFVRGIHRWLVVSPYKGPVMWKVFLCHEIIIRTETHSDLSKWFQNVLIGS